MLANTLKDFFSSLILYLHSLLAWCCKSSGHAWCDLHSTPVTLDAIRALVALIRHTELVEKMAFRSIDISTVGETHTRVTPSRKQEGRCMSSLAEADYEAGCQGSAEQSATQSREKDVFDPAGTGTRPGLHSQTLISTGQGDLDKLLGGGIPLGAVLLIQEDAFTQLHSTLLRSALSALVAMLARHTTQHAQVLIPPKLLHSRNPSDVGAHALRSVWWHVVMFTCAVY